jgi:hypothetical protein
VSVPNSAHGLVKICVPNVYQSEIKLELESTNVNYVCKDEEKQMICSTVRVLVKFTAQELRQEYMQDNYWRQQEKVLQNRKTEIHNTIFFSS